MTAAGDEKVEDVVIVAHAVKVRGLKGELVAELLTDFPGRFEKLSEIVGVAPNGDRQRLKLEDHWFQNDRVVLKFAGYDDVESALALVGFNFGVRESERIQLPAGQFYDWELEGCLVRIENGSTIGNVREVMRTGGVELLVVRDDKGTEHLIPMTESIVIDVDVNAKLIRVDPPEGLLDL